MRSGYENARLFARYNERLFIFGGGEFRPLRAADKAA
jgi:hypothetical protein